MAWVFAFIAAALLIAWMRCRRRSERHLRAMEGALDALGGAPAPESGHLLKRSRLEVLWEKLERTGRRQAMLLQEAEGERYNLETILGAMEEGLMVIDHRRVLRRVNPAFLQLFGMRDAPLGRTVLETLREPAFEELAVRALEQDAPQSGEVSLSAMDPVRQIAMNAVPLRDSEGRLGVLAIFRDVTRLKQLEDIRREFVANVSHEFRTPLSIFHGYVELLLDNPELPHEELRKVLDILKRHSMRLNALVEDLLALARLESGGERMQLEPMEIATWMRDIARDWTSKMQQKGVVLDLSIPEAIPSVSADPLRLEQVFNNLLENALKHTADGGKVVIEAHVEEKQGGLTLRVRDTGTGIPAAELTHIFERFYRADKARSREQGGTGLGLAIVKHIVQAHGGSVRAESVLGRGTCVIVTLPLPAASAGVAADT